MEKSLDEFTQYFDSYFYECVNTVETGISRMVGEGEMISYINHLYDKIDEISYIEANPASRRKIIGSFQIRMTKVADKFFQWAYFEGSQILNEIIKSLEKLLCKFPKDFIYEYPVPICVFEKQKHDLKIIHCEILDQCRLQNLDEDLIRILKHYFTLKDECKMDKSPSWSSINYLRTLSKQIWIVLQQEEPEFLEQRLFRLFIQFNFNKTQIHTYYINKVKKMKVDQSPKELKRLLVEAEYPSKKNMAYSFQNDSLRKGIRLHLQFLIRSSECEEQVMEVAPESREVIPPLFITHESSAVLMYLLSIAINKNIFKKMHNLTRTIEILSQLIRDPDGKKFKESTLTARYTSRDFKTLNRVDQLSAIFHDEHRHRKKLFYKKKHRR